MPIFAAFIPLIIDLIVKLLGWLIGKDKKNDQAAAIFRDFAEKLRVANIESIQKRKEAEDQLRAGNAAWDAREKLEQQKKGIKK